LSAGASKTSIAQSFVISTEHESALVQNYYQQYLARTAAAAEVAGWVNVLQHGASSEQVIADFLGSREYFSVHSANASDWLSSVYQKVLSRSPDQPGYDNWMAVLSK
jgi:hypothetical protein